MAKKSYLIPFDDKGNQMHYADPRVYPNGYSQCKDWREPFEFEANLEFQGYRRGRSAAYFEFKDLKSNLLYTVFLTDFEAIVQHMVCGKVKGYYEFIKRGQNYGIRLKPTKP